MSKIYDKLQSCLRQIKEKTDFVPEIAIVLGSGLGDFAANIEATAVISYSEIDGFPVSTAPGHAGRFIFGKLAGKRVVAMQGRVHYYEGYDISDVVLPIRLMRLLGASTLILTNAAGGISEKSYPGCFMLISDHICLAPSPLIGANLSEIGTRFPSMDNVYDRDLREIVKKCAAGIPIFEDVYIQTTGPQYETPAEIRMYKALGAGAVGMSTAVEAIAAVHCGFKVIGISCISNMACGLSDTPPSEQEVLEIANKSGAEFSKLITAVITNI
ncbi:MAG: purine-nucleoside phosphorylase [Ruminococcus sp.]|jgi:purine-nucleoside phosphorylase|nr:purine-nucleoside phosphorylase [Ruminococcus sp.]